jgi:regulator of RNase E activity RraB
MKETELEEMISAHEERNKELLQTIRTKGVSVNEERSVEHHFWAHSQMEAALLAKELYEQGFLVLVISPVDTEDGSELWNVEAGLKQSPAIAASRRVSENLVRLATRFNSIYDGWGMNV